MQVIGREEGVLVIVREEGALALWKGNWTAELLWGSYMGTQFMVYKTLQKACAGHNAANRAPGGQPAVWKTLQKDCEGYDAANRAPGGHVEPRNLKLAGVDMASGAASGAVATALTYPLDLLRTRLAAQQEPRVYRGLWDARSRSRGCTGGCGTRSAASCGKKAP
ncbi:hypothetical protein T484DRAFT_1837875 [Baffinella frigidus]|nr:hypothetical protein T484DRAFT_1837875 [Cryptophyta sp. CCMP2293]